MPAASHASAFKRALFNAIYRRLMSLSALVNDSGPARQCLSSGFGAGIGATPFRGWKPRLGDGESATSVAMGDRCPAWQ
jgi:hypothetical protein